MQDNYTKNKIVEIPEMLLNIKHKLLLDVTNQKKSNKFNAFPSTVKNVR